MDSANVQTNTDKKKEIKKVLLTVFIPLLASTAVLCIFLMYIGILQYPDWYLKANFRINKQYFETIINTGECDSFTSGQEYYIDEINDPTVKTAVQELFVNGTWGGFYKEYWHDAEEYMYLYGGNYSSEDNTDEKQREVVICVFRPKHSSDYNKKLLIYAKDDEVLKNKYTDFQHIQGNWYYVHYYDNNPWAKGG